ncbi:MAG: hypothetical protein RL693_984 [Verrucomicrobiota bacterium]
MSGFAFSQNGPAAERTWPQSVTLDDAPTVQVVKEDFSTREFIYRSPHYEFACDSKLRGDVVREFGRLFEATFVMNCKLPLDIRPEPEEGGTLFHARLFTTYEDYLRAGGMPGSAGVYISSKKELMVPLQSLGVRLAGNRVYLENNSDDDNATLIHEITHQMMNQWLGSMRIWQIEGSAEYSRILDYNRFGRFNLNNPGKQLKLYVKKRNPDGGGKTFVMANLETLMTMDNEQWAAALMSVRGIASINYGSAALLTYYFYHLDGSGNAADMIGFMRGLESAQSYEEEEVLVKKHLLRNRTYAQLAEDVKSAFRKEGIDISYLGTETNGRK